MDYKLYDAEFKFMQIIWELEPVNSTALSRACLERLGWKKSTTYNMLRKLIERGMVQNEQAMVSSLVKRDKVQQYESGQLMERAFGGSLPAFVAALLKDRKLSKQEAEEIRRMIAEAEE